MDKSFGREQSSKQANGILDNIRVFNERFQNGFSLDNPRLIERYVAGELEIHLSYVTFVGDKSTRIYFDESVALFKYLEFSRLRSRFKDPLSASSRTIRIDNNSGFNASNSSPRYYEKPVLVLNVESMEFPNGTPCPSLVCLQSAEYLYGGTTKRLYFAPLKGRYELRSTIGDWETNILTGVQRVIEPHELASKQVEGRSQIVDSVSESSNKVVGDRLDAVDDQEILEGLRVFLLDKGIWLSIEECLARRFKIRDVLLGPFDFHPNADKRMISCYHNDMNTLQDNPTEKKQKTSKGYEIPIPKKGDFFENLEKATESDEKPAKKSDSARCSRKDSKKK